MKLAFYALWLGVLIGHSIPASAAWAPVETIILKGSVNVIPAGGKVIHRIYGAGIYRFSLNLSAPGISFGTLPAVNTAFLEICDKNRGDRKIYSYDLNATNTRYRIIYPTDGGLDVDYFVENLSRTNSGHVDVAVEQWR